MSSSIVRRALAATVVLVLAVALLGPGMAGASIAAGKGVKFQAIKQGKRVAEIASFDIRVVGQCKGKSFGIPFGPEDVPLHMKFNNTFSVNSAGAFTGQETVSSKNGAVKGQSWAFEGDFSYTAKVKGKISDDGKSAEGSFWAAGSGESEFKGGACWTNWLPWKASL
jgi:hypothetical protein